MIEQLVNQRVTQLILGHKWIPGREWHPLDNPHRQQGQL
jgi:hypothetical protein